MRKWNINKGDPLSLLISADARITPPDYFDDQIWELSIGGGEPQALSITTTYGLRARSIRIFPSFTLGKKSIANPAEFQQPPVIKSIYPNLINLEFSPFHDIDVETIYWVPDSKSISARVIIHNNRTSNVNMNLKWVGILTPTDGERLSIHQIHNVNILSGKTENLFPVIFLTNGPQGESGSFPSLALKINLAPNSDHISVMVHAADSSSEESFSHTRRIAACKWEAEKSKIEMINSGNIEITTGNPDWDTAFMLSQNLVYRSFFSATSDLPGFSFVFNRVPDQGYSLRGDGSDYDHQWIGQNPLELYFILDYLLPESPELVEGAVRNFIFTQEENGFIDWKPGLAGQRSRILATPIIATIAWRLFEYSRNIQFLEEIFPALLKFLDYWLSPKQDKDGDGIPEWDHLFQTGYEDHPVYSQWREDAHGVNINTSESPALCAFLYSECQSLINIAEVLQKNELIPFIESKSNVLLNALEDFWIQELDIYCDRDRDTHKLTRGEYLSDRTGPGMLFINRNFDHPVRVFIRIISGKSTTLNPTLYIHGKSSAGNHRVEKINPEEIKWHLGIGRLTGENLYSRIEQIEIKNLETNDHILIYTAGYDCVNQTLFLPLWAGIPDNGKASVMIDQNLTNPERFWKKNGLQACVQNSTFSNPDDCSHINIIWNSMVGEGLIRYENFQIAADLVSKLMDVIIHSLKEENTFRRNYHPEKYKGLGERGALSGIAPIGLFLFSLGVKIFSNKKVFIEGNNPFPWNVSIQYRGLKINRRKNGAEIKFPDGQMVEISGPEPQVITMN